MCTLTILWTAALRTFLLTWTSYYNGSDDTQCAKGRSGTLCGDYQPGLSLSLNWKLFTPTVFFSIVQDTSCYAHHCFCSWYSHYWLTYGIKPNCSCWNSQWTNLLCQLQHTECQWGTIISLSTKVPSVFISWLNLEVGFDIILCFFEGMDTYWKSWLQLAFPSYILLLLLLVIIVSDHSVKFSQLLATRNPVAAPATRHLQCFSELPLLHWRLLSWNTQMVSTHGCCFMTALLITWGANTLPCLYHFNSHSWHNLHNNIIPNLLLALSSAPPE